MALDKLGFIKTSLVDYPGKVAAVIFTAGCPLACPYCHNAELVPGPYPDSFLPADEVFHLLGQRAHLIEGVAVTGGEPLVHPGITGIFDRIAELDLPVKLDTCGALGPGVLERAIAHPAVHFVALDFKTSPSHYGRLRGRQGSGERVLGSLEVLRGWKRSRHAAGLPGDYEIRTVCAPGVVDEADLQELSELVGPDETWTLTRFNPAKVLDPAIRELPPVPEEVIRKYERADPSPV